jgi:hypothetical protein
MRKSGVLLLLVLGVALSVTYLWAQSRTPTPAVTRTQRIELVDKDGKVRAELKISGNDTLLVLYDGQGRLRTLVNTNQVVFYDPDGKVRSRVEAQTP